MTRDGIDGSKVNVNSYIFANYSALDYFMQNYL